MADKLKDINKVSKKVDELESSKTKGLIKPSDIDDLEFIKIICLNNPYILGLVKEKYQHYFAARGEPMPKIAKAVSANRKP